MNHYVMKPHMPTLIGTPILFTIEKLITDLLRRNRILSSEQCEGITEQVSETAHAICGRAQVLPRSNKGGLMRWIETNLAATDIDSGTPKPHSRFWAGMLTSQSALLRGILGMNE
jgi:hypothetical protein